MPKFNVGDSVKWTSQAQGSSKTKVGTVEVIKHAGERLSVAQREELPGAGGSRQHESYLVRVPGKTARSRGKVYWPVVSRLKRA